MLLDLQGDMNVIKNTMNELKKLSDEEKAENYIKENTELKAQIEKMKCCENCKHFDFNEPNYCHKGVYRKRQYVCSGWELAE